MRSAGFVLGLCVVLVSGSASAQLSDKDKERAVALMVEGVQKRDAGDLRGALKNFEDADAIVSLPSTAAEVAKARAALGMLKEAIESADRALAFPIRKDEPAPFKQARKDCEALKQDLTQRMPTLAIHVNNVSSKQSCSVAVGKLSASCDMTDKPQRMNPGAHHIVLTVDGEETSDDVVLTERQNRVLNLDYVQKSVTLTSESKPVNESARYLFYGGFILGGAGVAIGSVTGILSLGNASDAQALCKNGKCPASAREPIDSAKALGTISTVTFIIGGAGVACGIAGLVMGPFGGKVKDAKDTEPKDPDGASKGEESHFRVQPTVWLGGGGLAGTF